MPEPSITTPFLITRSYAIARSSRPGPRGHACRRIVLRCSGGREAGTHRGWRAVGTGRLRLAKGHRDVETRLPRDNLDLESRRPCVRKDLLDRRRWRWRR